MRARTVRSLATLSELQALYSLRNYEARAGLEEFEGALYDIEYKYKKELKVIRKPNCLTPPQQKRVQLIIDQMLGFSRLEIRAFFHVLNYKEQKAADIIPSAPISSAPNYEKTTQNYWAPIHPQNLAFQDEIGLKGLVGLHGFPKEFMDKLLSGSMFNSIDLTRAGGSEPAQAPKEPEKPKEEIFDLFIKGFSADGKVKLIKELKDMLSLGLKEAKDKLEASATTPILLAKRVKQETQTDLVEKLKGFGAVLEFVKVS
mmetsp:Transcript_23677/g.41942  ORF Transcript_23677/g.41942 Transcript_23677/m.41942 type:complete len:258 (+) Transcript_23677:769-1542(+)